jgi:cytochrome P450
MTLESPRASGIPAPRDGGGPTARRIPWQRERSLDPPGEYARLRAEEPVSRLAFPDGVEGWLVSRYEDVRELLADPRISSRNKLGVNPVRPLPPGAESLLDIEPGQFIRMDPPDHTRYRKLLTGQFTVRRMQALAPRVQQIVDERLDAMAAQPPPADLVQAFALPVPSLVICELLGVPYADRALFQRRSRLLLSMDTDAPTLLRARDELRAYMLDLVRAKKAEPADDLLSGLAGQDLTELELVNIGNLLLVAGHETTANMLALGTLLLLQHPDQVEALRADPALVGSAVEELLRYLTIVQFGVVRTALEDLEVGGQRIRAGELVVASLASANRDAEQFADPNALDLAREYAPHLAFGHGVHQCLGQQLARVEMRAGFASLLARFPSLRLAVPPEQVPMRDDTFILGVRELPVTW